MTKQDGLCDICGQRLEENVEDGCGPIFKENLYVATRVLTAWHQKHTGLTIEEISYEVDFIFHDDCYEKLRDMIVTKKLRMK